MALMIEDKKRGKLLVGIELSEDAAQASYLRPDAPEAETMAVVPGTEMYDVPLLLGRRKSDGSWLYGRDAQESIRAGEALEIRGLLALARSGETLAVGEETYQGLPLLALFCKKLLSDLVSQVAGPGESLRLIDGIRFTLDEPDEGTVRAVTELGRLLLTSAPELRLVDQTTHAESFHSYLLAEAPGLEDSLAVWSRGGRVVSFRHAVNRRTQPVVASTDRVEEGPAAGAETDRDGALLDILEKRLKGRETAAVYLLGDFEEAWLRRSLDYICRGRRAFLGNNLFSRGAAEGLRAKLQPPREERPVFLGPEKLMANVGIRCKKQGESHYHALLDAGANWYEASAALELILDKDEMVALEVTPLANGPRHSEVLRLAGIGHTASRERRATRISLELTMLSLEQAQLVVRDLGFGEFYPSTGGQWKKTFSLYDKDAGPLLAEGIVSEPILCLGKLAEHPFEFSFLECRIYSVEELCLFFSRNDYLLTMNEMTEELCVWLERECGLAPLADELSRLRRRDCSMALFAGTVLEYLRLYPKEEIARIVEVMRLGDARDSVGKKLRIIEYLIGEGRLAEAVEQIRRFDRREKPPVVLARLSYDEGVVYARLFHFDAAASCMERAYRLSGDRQVKEAYLAALRLSMSEEEYIARIGARPELSPESLTLETRLGEVMELFAAGADNHTVNTMGVCLDTGNTAQFDEEIAGAEAELVARFKRAAS